MAEVLITLGIIGVVAALTIPRLIQNYTEHVTVTRVKKVYSVLASAVNSWQIENGCETDASVCLSQYERWDCKNAFSGIEKRLNIVEHRYRNEPVSKINWLPEFSYGLNGQKVVYSWQGVNKLENCNALPSLRNWRREFEKNLQKKVGETPTYNLRKIENGLLYYFLFIQRLKAN